MAIHYGVGGVAKLGSDVIAAITQWSTSETIETIDTTVIGATSHTHIVDVSEWSGALEAQYDTADTDGQLALTIGSSVTLKLYDDGTASGKKYKSGTATVTGVSLDTSVSSIVSISFSFKGNGPLTTLTVGA